MRFSRRQNISLEERQGLGIENCLNKLFASLFAFSNLTDGISLVVE